MATGDPYCSNCKYSLIGLTDSAKCPECGRPLVEVLQRHGGFIGGRRYTSDFVLFGLPLVQIAYGPYGDERKGRARAIIAIGDVAYGWIAMGGRAVGIVAAGGVAIGVVAIGGCTVGLLAFGGLALGAVVSGGLALALLANGGLAAGLVAQGGLAIGYLARGGRAIGPHAVSPIARDPQAIRFFEDWSWMFGNQANMVWMFNVWLAVGILAVAAAVCLVIALAYIMRRSEPELK